MDLSDLLKKGEPLPTKTELLAYLKSLPPDQLQEIDRLISTDPRPWLPLPGPQISAFYCEADELYYGGQAGGGKTDLLIGLSATAQWSSIIFRREFPQLRAIEQRLKDLFEPTHGKLNRVSRVMSFKSGRQLELGSMQHFDDREKYQGRPHDAKLFDEITHFLEMQYRYVIGWLRTTRRGVRTRVVAAGNPPLNAEGRWVIKYWAPWLDDRYPKPAKPGELRHFIVDSDSRDIEVEAPGVYSFKGEEYESRSRTFLPSALTDNPYINASYKATLNGLPEPLRSQLMRGDFKAGIEDDQYQLFPTDWVKDAMARWRAMKEPTQIPIEQVGLDVSRGGRDKTVATPRRGHYFCKQEEASGVSMKDGPAVATFVLKKIGANRNIVVAIDAVGVGVSPLDTLRANNVKVLPIIASAKSMARDKTGMLSFVNLRAEIFWAMREALDPASGMNLAIEDHPELMGDLCAYRFKLTPRGIQVSNKDDIHDIIGRSPDRGDSLIYAHANPSLAGQGVFDLYAKEYEELMRKQAEEAERRGYR